MRGDLVAAIAARTRREGDCLVWTGSMTGRTPVWGKPPKNARRISYEISVGEIPPGYWVWRSCRNDRCVEPSHLRATTPEECGSTFGEVSGDLATDEARRRRLMEASTTELLDELRRREIRR